MKLLFMKSMRRRLFQLFYRALLLNFLCLNQLFALDATPFNTQFADISQGGWWTLYSEAYFNRKNKLINPIGAELRYTFFDKLRLGALSNLGYASDGKNSIFGVSDLILTTELEVYDRDKYDFLKIGSLEYIDHAAIFFNQFIPITDDKKLGTAKYSYDLGIEWQKQFNNRTALFSELGYSYLPDQFSGSDHNFSYNNALSFEVNSWLQPYIELLGVTNLNDAETELLLAPGFSINHNKQLYFYLNPIFSVNGKSDWGFQFGASGIL